MARIPYADLNNPEAKPLVDRITAERGSVLHIYQMLMHSPPVASGWLNFFTAIRQQNSLPGALRELVIMRIAIVNGAPYEAEQHAPFALREGVTQAQLDDLASWESSKQFDPTQRAVLAYADAMTKNIQVSPEVFAGVKALLSDRLIVELTATIGGYNMVSRFLEALQIHSHDAR
jgi:AhpD family alkylhydroperoxidase